MILKTNIEWEQSKDLSDKERELMEARAEVDPGYNPHDDEDLFELVIREAIIDTDNNKLYVEVSKDKICMTELLGGQYIGDGETTQRIEERLYFKSTLEEIYGKLIKK